MAIKAFDAEMATISHSVKTPEGAAMRYEFWRIGLRKIKAKDSGRHEYKGYIHVKFNILNL